MQIKKFWNGRVDSWCSILGVPRWAVYLIFFGIPVGCSLFRWLLELLWGY